MRGIAFQRKCAIATIGSSSDGALSARVCISARVAERGGCQAAAISGAALTASVLGYPDVGLQTMTEVLNQARNIGDQLRCYVRKLGQLGLLARRKFAVVVPAVHGPRFERDAADL